MIIYWSNIFSLELCKENVSFDTVNLTLVEMYKIEIFISFI